MNAYCPVLYFILQEVRHHVMEKYLHELLEERSRIPGYFVPGERNWGPEAYCGVVCAVKRL
jgi:hypothetical protein